ncbi:MAG: phosphoribosylformylglycinamidine synthase subunit PurL [Actinobacteria bacterium]|nr:phosphoribosylformylglycinamidine synthase subunit PurL [Actinomycetota bacterium]
MWRVEVALRPDMTDALGSSIRKQINEDLRIDVEKVQTIDVYTITSNLTQRQIEAVARDLLTDPITQDYRINTGFDRPFSVAIEVGYKPGVTDNVGATAVEGIEDLLGIKFSPGEFVHTSKLYLLSGKVSRQEAEEICTGLLANPLIEHFQIWHAGEDIQSTVRKVAGPSYGSSFEPRVAGIDLDVSDDELLEISRKGVLSLNLEEMRKIRAYFKDDRVKAEREKVGLGPRPTDVELEMLAQTWSEHCKHKIFNATIDYTEGGKTEKIESLFKTYIRRATEEIAREKDWLVSVFVDNAGVVGFDDNYNMVFKVETHNHPSALDPYGGAVTGIVGVNRDPMGTGLGADLIFNTDVFCFGPPDFPYKKLPASVLHPKRIFKGVRKGVEDGGNKIGIPTVNGSILFDEAYVYNPLVYCGTGGFMPKEIAGRPSHEKQVQPGDLVVMTGGRIGKDGIHGATFSSVALDEETSSAAVQIGAPIVQRKMQDALKEARDMGLYRAITDNGAGGLSSSVGEMSEFCGGCEVDLEKAPTKYPGLHPWELWVSESQERMTLAVPPEKIDAFLDLCRRRDVEATVIGTYTDSGKVHVKYGEKTVAYLDIDFVHEGLPGLKLTAKWQPKVEGEVDASPVDPTGSLRKILSSYNICSKEWVIRQYDHEVQGGSVVKPLVGSENDGPSDAAVIRPLVDSKRGIAVSNGINPKYGEIDTYAMAASAIDEAVRNIVAVGGDPDRIAILDNFCWGNPILSESNPDGDHKLAQLVRAAKGCYDTAIGLGTPFISGKDSFHNEYRLENETIAIPPTLLISAIGVVPDVGRAVTMDVKSPGDIVYILGETFDELGGSHYCMIGGARGGSVPKVDAVPALKLYRALHGAIQSGLVVSCHDCSEGGIAVAAAESAFAGGLGMRLDIAKVPASQGMADERILFSESNSRFVVTVSPEKKEAFEAELAGNSFAEVGLITGDKSFIVTGKDGTALIDTDIDELKEAWKAPLRW